MKHADVPFVIDFHTHMLGEELRSICTSRNAITGFGKKQAPPSANLRKFLDPELQIADMDERGHDGGEAVPFAKETYATSNPASLHTVRRSGRLSAAMKSSAAPRALLVAITPAQ